MASTLLGGAQVTAVRHVIAPESEFRWRCGDPACEVVPTASVSTYVRMPGGGALTMVQCTAVPCGHTGVVCWLVGDRPEFEPFDQPIVS